MSTRPMTAAELAVEVREQGIHIHRLFARKAGPKQRLWVSIAPKAKTPVCEEPERCFKLRFKSVVEA